MRRVFELIEKVASTPTTVLLTGESGTGKEVAARALHELSGRADGPFVVVDCGALPPTLIESELYGHERGAFTGADRPRKGAFEEATGGTLFLDEIGELPLDLQTRLLGAIERRQIQPLGGSKSRPIDVRMIAATNRDLRREVNRGNFRGGPVLPTRRRHRRDARAARATGRHPALRRVVPSRSGRRRGKR